MAEVFISHSSIDAAFAQSTLAPFLQSHGISTWFSDQDMPSAADWEKAIRAALCGAQWVIVVLSPDATESDWVQAEVHWALENRKGRVIPLLLRDCDPGDLHLKLPRIQHIDFRSDPGAAAAQLLRVLKSNSYGCETASREQDQDDEKTVILGPQEIALRFLVVEGPQQGSSFDVRVRWDCILGRGADADIRLLDESVSRRHAKICVASSKGLRDTRIIDLASANGTFVNDSRILEPTPIRKGDRIDLGGTRLLLEDVT